MSLETGKSRSDCSRCRSHGVGVICRSACSGCLLCFCPWRGRRNEPSVHARDRERPCVAKDRHPSLSVPIHGGRLEASGSSRPCPSYSSCRRADRYQARAPKDPDRRREVIWRTHDVAGAGCCAFTKGSRPRVMLASRCTRRTSPPPRARHLARIDIPMLFIQGDRDAWQTESSCSRRSRSRQPRRSSNDQRADHSFHVLARSGRTDKQALDDLLDGLAGWIMGIVDGDR